MMGTSALADTAVQLKLLVSLIAAEFAVFGIIILTVGWIGLASKNAARFASRRLRKELVQYGLLDDSADAAAPEVRRVVRAWLRWKARIAVGAGVGVVIASAVAAIAVFLTPVTLPPGATINHLTVSGPVVNLFDVLLRAQIAGLSVLLFIGVGFPLIAGLHSSPSDAAPTASLHNVTDYRSPIVLRLIAMGAAVEIVLVVVSSPRSFLSLEGGGLWNLALAPGLMLLTCIGCEIVLGRAVRAHYALPSDGNAFADSLEEATRRSIVTYLVCGEIGAVTFMVCNQLAYAATHGVSRTGAAPVVVYLLLCVASCMVACGLAGKAYGRFGGRRTGWPWQRPMK